jgi:hypothetical protein
VALFRIERQRRFGFKQLSGFCMAANSAAMQKPEIDLTPTSAAPECGTTRRSIFVEPRYNFIARQ